MDERQWIENIEDLCPRGDEPPSAELLERTARAVEATPWSSELWYLRGIVMSLSECAASDVLNCFLKAIELDRGNFAAHQEAGYVLEVYDLDLPRAKACFETAISLGAGVQSYVGLARTLAELGETEAARELLQQGVPSPVKRRLRK